MLFLKHGEKNPNFLFAPGRESNDILWKNVKENLFSFKPRTCKTCVLCTSNEYVF